MRDRLWIIGIVSFVLALAAIVTALYGLGFADRTLFEWMDILIVPIAVGIGLYELEQSQRRREQRREQNEQRRREEEQERAEALQSYFDQMNQMLLDNDVPLSSGPKGDAVRELVRGRTLSILSVLDPVRKGLVVKFLYESGLITADYTVVSLERADLNEAFLRNQSFPNINLVGTQLRGANLAGANLRAARFDRAALYEANLSFAFLGDAYLRQANLSGADLTGAEGITAEELEQQALSLAGAIMPDGQLYEDWRRDKEGSGNDVELHEGA